MTENGQNEGASTERLTRRRGVGFPVVPLPKAVTILRKAGQHGHEYSMNAFAAYAGHNTANSGSFKRRLAAFRDWGLVAGSSGDRVILTDLGRRLAFPTDPAKETQDLREAFENCDLFMRVWDDYAKGIAVSLGTLANLGVRDLGVAPVSRERFAESLALSAVAAGYAEQDGERIRFIQPAASEVRGVDASVTDMHLGIDGAVQSIHGDDVDSADEEEHGPVPIPSPDLRPVDFVGVGARAQTAVAAGMGMSRVMTEEKETPPEPPKVIVVRAPDEKPAALLHQQSWEIGGGSLTLEIRSSRDLPADAFIQIAAIMREVAKLKDLLVDDATTGFGSEESGE